MNKEQQIKEMTQDFINFGITTRQGDEAFAEILYNAGYRKISEDNICEAVEKPVNTPKRKYESIEDIVRGFVKMSNKEQQIEEIEQFIYDYVDSKQTERVYLLSSRVNELAKPFVHNKGLAEALYNAGCRKLSEDSVVLSREEHEILVKTAQGKIGNMKATDLLKACISSGFMVEAVSTKEQVKQAVKEFAQKLKKRSYCDNDFMDGKWHRYVFVDEIDELLKEYEK